MIIELTCNRCERSTPPVEGTARCQFCGGDVSIRELPDQPTFIVHPSQLRDRLSKLGYALFDVAQDEQLSDFDADNALHLALVGGDEFERLRTTREIQAADRVLSERKR